MAHSALSPYGEVLSLRDQSLSSAQELGGKQAAALGSPQVTGGAAGAGLGGGHGEELAGVFP